MMLFFLFLFYITQYHNIITIHNTQYCFTIRVYGTAVQILLWFVTGIKLEASLLCPGGLDNLLLVKIQNVGYLDPNFFFVPGFVHLIFKSLVLTDRILLLTPASTQWSTRQKPSATSTSCTVEQPDDAPTSTGGTMLSLCQIIKHLKY